jgi:membrane fusion protein (multidrug efflux system)
VSGVILRRFFTEGALVRKGQTLYEIDPSLYRAAANEARANLQSAAASAEARGAQAQRLKPLAEMEAVAKQDYTDAVAAARQARAAVAQSQAQLQTAQINLHYTTVPAPITGRIGRSLVTVGALVTSNQDTALAQISQLDPMFVDIQQSSADLLTLRRMLAKGGAVPTKADVQLTLEDGSAYGYTGTVDPGTGTVTLRARFPNPEDVLLPGMFVRARFTQAIDRAVVLVPQTAVSRDPAGIASVFVVGAGNKAEQRTITTTRTQGPNWVVTAGIRPGDKIIVQGTDRLRPGGALKPVPANTPQRVAPAGKSKGS